MFSSKQINDTRNQLLVLAQERNGRDFLRYAVEIIVNTLNLYFVGIYLADEKKEFINLQAGSGEFGEKLLKHGHQIKITESGNFNEQAGTAYLLNEVRLTDLEAGQIFAWKTSAENISEAKIGDDINLFVGSPIFPHSWASLFLPIQRNKNILGVLEITFDVMPNFSNPEILKLQEIANEIALELV